MFYNQIKSFVTNPDESSTLLSRRLFLLGIGSFVATVKIGKPTNAITAVKEDQKTDQVNRISGTVFYRQRIALPPNAILVLTLADISRADAPATLIVEKKINLMGRQVPIPFTLTYNSSQLDPRFRYSLRAQIFVENQLQWTSTRVYSINPQNDSTELNIQLEQVGR
jgi:putative lipoprotein